MALIKVPDKSEDTNLSSNTGEDGDEITKIESNISEEGKEKRKKRRLQSCDISNPQDFTHVAHVAPRPIIKIDLDDPYIKKFLQQAGVTAAHLENPATFETIALFIQTNGMDRIRKEVNLLEAEKIENETNTTVDTKVVADSCNDKFESTPTTVPKNRKSSSSSSDSGASLNDKNTHISGDETGNDENKLVPGPQTKGALPNKFAIWLKTKRNKHKNEPTQAVHKNEEAQALNKKEESGTPVKKKKMFAMPSSTKSKKDQPDSDQTLKAEKNNGLLNIFYRKRNSFKNKKADAVDTTNSQKNEEVEGSNSLETIPKELDFSLEKTDLQENNCTLEQAEEMVTTSVEIMPVLPKVEELELNTVQNLNSDARLSYSSVSDEVFEEKSRSCSSSASTNSDITVLPDVSHQHSQPLVAQEVLENQQEIYTTEYYDDDYNYLEYKAAAKEIQNMRKSWSCVMAELKERLPDDEHTNDETSDNQLQYKESIEQLDNFDDTNISQQPQPPYVNTVIKNTADNCGSSETRPSASSLSDEQLSENDMVNFALFSQDKAPKIKSLKSEDTLSSSSSVSDLNEDSSSSKNSQSSSDEKQSSSNDDIDTSDDGMSDSNTGHLQSELKNITRIDSSSNSSISTTSDETKILFTYDVEEVTRQNSLNQNVTIRNKESRKKMSHDEKLMCDPQSKKSTIYSENRPLSASPLVLRPISLEESDDENELDFQMRNKNGSNIVSQFREEKKREQLGPSEDKPHQPMNTVINISNLPIQLPKDTKEGAPIHSLETNEAGVENCDEQIERIKEMKSPNFDSTTALATKSKKLTSNDKETLFVDSSKSRDINSASNLQNFVTKEHCITFDERLPMPHTSARSHSTAGEETVEFRTRRSDFSSTHNERRVSVERNASYHRAIETERSKSLEAAASRIQKADSVNRRSRIPRPILKSSARHTIDFPLPTHRVTEL